MGHLALKRLETQVIYCLLYTSPSPRDGTKSRKNQLSEIYDVLRKNCKNDRIVIYADSVSTESEAIFETTLSEADASSVSMKTLVIIGSSSTKKIRNTGYIYTPRYSGVEKN